MSDMLISKVQRIEVVVGGQFGSEGKGHVAAQRVHKAITHRESATRFDSSLHYDIINVRVAGPNAGHTVVDLADNHIALRQIPVGVVDSRCVLYIAPGSEIDVDVLRGECEKVTALGHDIHNRLFISPQATILTPEHIAREQNSDIIARLGSTAKGIGAARVDRIMRTATIARDSSALKDLMDQFGLIFADPRDLYPPTKPAWIIIEGTQGYGLGLHTDNYPQVTSSDTRAIDFMAMSGVNHRTDNDVIIYVAARVFPIRVAGNSGALQGETTWEDLGLEAERTTVTQKIRRVGEWDADLIREAVAANGGFEGGVRLVITMVDQIFPDAARLAFDGTENIPADRYEAYAEVRAFLDSIEQDARTTVAGFTTAPDTIAWI